MAGKKRPADSGEAGRRFVEVRATRTPQRLFQT